jgi:D-alanyl-D-alanine carboxypeptidase/D-alanyl-D-alanine-endopeptidase (penicillin-binding protein 4)
VRRTLVAVLALLLLLPGAQSRPGATPDLSAGAAAPDSSTSAPPVSSPPVAAVDPVDDARPVLLPPRGTAPLPTTAGVQAALEELITAPALGGSPGVVVLDAETGQALLNAAGSTPRIPASAAKLVTGAAVLSTLGPQARRETRVVSGSAPGEIVLVGGGDPRLRTAAPAPEAYPAYASLSELAARTAAALSRMTLPAGQAVTVRVDDSLFTGPAVSPDWQAMLVPGGFVAPVSALSVDGGRVDPAADARVADPALAAGEAFAELLRAAGVAVDAEVRRATAPRGTSELASVASPPMSVLVEESLLTSDNDIAETLLRLAALAAGQPASFAGGAATASAVLAELGVDAAGLDLRDGSGLARTSRVAPSTLATLLATATSEGHPQLRPLLTGLPVAGFSGTLAERFLVAGEPTAGAGLVRAKTGTLTGVSSLAGIVEGADGRTLVFAVLADDVPATLAARNTLDRVATALAGCGCR